MVICTCTTTLNYYFTIESTYIRGYTTYLKLSLNRECSTCKNLITAKKFLLSGPDVLYTKFHKMKILTTKMHKLRRYINYM